MACRFDKVSENERREYKIKAECVGSWRNVLPDPCSDLRAKLNNSYFCVSGWDSLREPSRKGPRDKGPRAKGPGPRVQGVVVVLGQRGDTHEST